MKIEKTKLIIYSVVAFLIIAMVIVANVIAVYFEQSLLLYLGTVGGNNSNLSLSSFESDEELRVAQEQLVREIVDEGAVLLKNNDTLPLSSSAKITLFGQSSVHWANGAVGSAAMAETSSGLDLKGALEQSKFAVNETVWNYYKNTGKKRAAGGSGQSADWSLNETDWSSINSSCVQSFAGFNDAAIVILSRTGCEGADVPMEMSRYDGLASESYLELSSTELGLLKGIKAAGFKKTLVILRTSNAMQMDFLNSENTVVDACIWLSSTGDNGIEQVGKILCGDVNPSGHLANALVYDNFSSPAMQNFGDFRYTTANGELTEHNYIHYAEGIYVGYKYYETRYEDKVMGTGNSGDYNYRDVVAYPFGYGLSYTNFEYDDFSMESEDGVITVNVTVKNIGDVKGKDAVQVYFQSPFSQYDMENGVEKASINLAAIKKTSYLEPDATETVSLSFNAEDVMKSYDAKHAKGYIMDDGDYYITVAQDSHEALNNILSKKGYSVANGMTYGGNESMVNIYTVDEFKNIIVDAATGNTVTNRFDDAYLPDAVSLSRKNWSAMENDGLLHATGVKSGVSHSTDADKNVYTMVADTTLIDNLNNISWSASGIPASAEDKSDVVYDKSAAVKFYDMKGVDYDSDLWDELVQQMSISELHTLYNKAGYITQQIDSINKPRTYDYDGPLGLSSYVSGWNSFEYPSTIMLATSFNTELAERMGSYVGEDGIRAGISGWYAPAMNIHRTPFSGRNYEYFSEDAVLSGIIGAAEIKGGRSKGLCTYIKHFAVNDMETRRSSLAVWLDEQTMREIYLKPFEYGVKDGETNALMASMNRIGYRYTRGSYALLTSVLREEWGFLGAVITDFTATRNEYADMALAAGVDLQLNSVANPLTSTKSNEVRHALQRAAKNTCYMVANSFMIDLDGGSFGFPVWIIIVILLDVVAFVGCAIGEFVFVREYLRKKRADKMMEEV